MKKLGRKIGIALCGLLCFPCACGEKKEELTVYMPDGAPSLALAGLMAQNREGDGFSYRVVQPSEIEPWVTYADEEKNADFCVLPLTSASALLGAGDRYVMLGTVTHGNLYLLSKDSTPLQDLSPLTGKRVGVLQMQKVPGQTLKATLNRRGLSWQVITNEGGMVEDKVNLLPITGANAVGKPFEDGAGNKVLHDYYLLAEPAATATVKANAEYQIVGDLQELYGGGFPQAVLVAKKSLVENRLDTVKAFTADLEASIPWIYTASGEEIVDTVSANLRDKGSATSLKAPLLTTDVLDRCSIRFTYAASDFTKVNEYLQELATFDDKTVLPQANFYWTYTK